MDLYNAWYCTTLNKEVFERKLALKRNLSGCQYSCHQSWIVASGTLHLDTRSSVKQQWGANNGKGTKCTFGIVSDCVLEDEFE